MNSRSVSNKRVNFSTDLATTLNQLDKEPLLTFPFDHLYACSDTGNRGQTLHLKEVEISTHRIVPIQDKHVNQKLSALERQNKKLKDLLIYHLDLIQQQNELMSKKEKAFQALKQENDTLKSKVSRAGVEQRVSGQHALIPSSLHMPTTLHIPVTSTVTSAYKTDLPSATPQTVFPGFNQFLFDDPTVLPTYAYNPGLSTPKPLDLYGLDRPSDTVAADLQNFFGSELAVPSLLEVTPLVPELQPETFTMIENKRPKREPKAVDPNNEPKYTVTTSSGTPKISRNRKRSTGIGSFSRMPKTKPAPKPQKSTIYDNDLFSVKQSKMPYGKSKLAKYGYTALQERLQLIEPTPTGEDPYQIGEAEMREQSPIPKLMLTKTNHGRMKVSSESVGVTSTITSTTASRRIYDTLSSVPSSTKTKRSKIKTDPYSASNMHVQSKKDTVNASLEDELELDVEKTDGVVDWHYFVTNKPKETSLCDFSYGETSANLVNKPLDITKLEFPDFFEPGPVNADSSSVTEIEAVPTQQQQQAVEKTKKRGARTTSLAGPHNEEKIAEPKRTSESKRGRKRAHSSAASVKRGDNAQPKVPAKRARRAVRAKKTPVPGMMTKKLYHTCMGDPDLSWYLGLDPDIKKEDCDLGENTSSNVEVPRWRELSFTSIPVADSFEDLDDRAYEKRHQKLEIEERRQLRWHMRRVREQRHVERLRQRQRDTWGPNSSQAHSRREHSIWPQPIRDLQFIELANQFPVVAFGDDVPDLPKSQFQLPWMVLSQALKRSKRSKTLH